MNEKEGAQGKEGLGRTGPRNHRQPEEGKGYKGTHHAEKEKTKEITAKEAGGKQNRKKSVGGQGAGGQHGKGTCASEKLRQKGDKGRSRSKV